MYIILDNVNKCVLQIKVNNPPIVRITKQMIGIFMLNTSNTIIYIFTLVFTWNH